MMLGIFHVISVMGMGYDTGVLYVWGCLHFSDAHHLFQALKKYMYI